MAWYRVYRPLQCAKHPISLPTMVRITDSLISSCHLTASHASGLSISDDLTSQIHRELQLEELGGDRTDLSKWLSRSMLQDITRWFEPVPLSLPHLSTFNKSLCLRVRKHVIDDGSTPCNIYGPPTYIRLKLEGVHLPNCIPQPGPEICVEFFVWGPTRRSKSSTESTFEFWTSAYSKPFSKPSLHIATSKLRIDNIHQPQ